jgi:superfamily II DNA or RNA helicase
MFDGARVTPASAAEVARVIVARRFGAGRADGSTGLAAFQADAVMRLEGIISRFGGAVLADSVGLGKTHVAASLIRTRLEQGATVLVVGPSALAIHWKRHLRYCAGWLWRSHTSMSRRGTPVLPALKRPLIVVDEAHAFRNPATRRYHTLAACAPAADVLLLTATPVNNSVHDFYHLLRLFATDNAFADLGVPDLRNAAELAAAGNGGLLHRVALAVMVRRTRSDVALWQDLERRTLNLRFPAREPARLIIYDVDARRAGLCNELARDVLRLTFPVHASSGDAPLELLRLGLLKRLESSTAALTRSLQTHRRTLQQFSAAAAEGWLLDAPAARTLLPEIHGAVQLVIPGIALRKWPAGLDADACLEHAQRDEAIIARMLQRLHRADGTPEDAKVACLADLLAGEYKADRVIVFTEFRDTARALWSRLRDRERVALIDGAEARLGRDRASRRMVIDRFAPRANGARAPTPREAVRVLIATDVLAEGLNLQDARVVISYDLPWNPVRLAQRIGRIDRLGSPHDRVVALVFSPGAGLERVLRLTRRLRRKLRHIRMVGGDAPWIAGRLGRSSEAVVLERLRAEFARQQKQPRGTTGRLIAPDAPQPALAAAVHWSGTRRAALCCVGDGSRAQLWLVPRRGPAEPEPACAAQVLLDALRSGDEVSIPCDTRRAAAAGARALRACAQPAPLAGATRPASARAARVVHRWLRRDAEGSEAACRIADLVLAWLNEPGDVATEATLAAVLRTPGRDADRVAALRSLAEARAARTGTAEGERSVSESEGQRARAGVEGARDERRLLAVLELIPTTRERPAGAASPQNKP